MKKQIIMLVAVIVMAFGTSSRASAEDYFSEMTGGDNYIAFNGGEDTASAELGWLISGETNQLFAVGVYFINNGEAVHSAKGSTQGTEYTATPFVDADGDGKDDDPDDHNLFDFDRGNGHLTDGGKTLNDEKGVFVKYGLEVVPDSGFYITGLLGVAHAHETQLWITDNRAFDYTEESSKLKWLYGGGVTWIINDGMVLQVDYDNRREWTVGIGFVY